MTDREANLVSVVISCYNQAHFLSEAIWSVLSQTYPHFELIVVDDGSTDNTSEVATRYPGVRCIPQKNQGVSEARNAGLRKSKGSYLVFLDADDRLLPNALEDGVSCLNAQPECAFVYGHVKLIASDGSPLPPRRQACIERDHYLTLLRKNYIWTPGVVMYRRSVFDSVAGFDTLVNASADFDLNIRIAKSFPICCHDKVVLEYRKHGANMSGKVEEMLRTSMIVLRSQWKYVKGSRQYKEALKIGITAVQKDYGEKLVKQVHANVQAREWEQATRGMLALVRYYPRGFVRHACQKLYRIVFKVRN